MVELQLKENKNNLHQIVSQRETQILRHKIGWLETRIAFVEITIDSIVLAISHEALTGWFTWTLMKPLHQDECIAVPGSHDAGSSSRPKNATLKDLNLDSQDNNEP